MNSPIRLIQSNSLAMIVIAAIVCAISYTN